MVINSDNATRKNQMMMSFQTGILISVASIHGTNAEKKIMADTLTDTDYKFSTHCSFSYYTKMVETFLQ